MSMCSSCHRIGLGGAALPPEHLGGSHHWEPAHHAALARVVRSAPQHQLLQRRRVVLGQLRSAGQQAAQLRRSRGGAAVHAQQTAPSRHHAVITWLK